MADSTNGNGLQLDLSQKKLGITGPHVALLLLIIIIGAVAYIRTGTLDKTLHAGQEQLAATEVRVHGRVSELLGRVDKLLEELQAQNLLLATHQAKLLVQLHEERTHADTERQTQSLLLQRQTETLATQVQRFEHSLHRWLTELGTRVEIMNHNLLHPDRPLHFRNPVPPEAPQPEPGH